MVVITHSESQRSLSFKCEITNTFKPNKNHGDVNLEHTIGVVISTVRINM